MPDADNVLYLCESEAPDLRGLRSLSCLPGRAGVLMHRAATRGGVYMPGSGRLNPDVGTLVYADIEGPIPGAEVIVKPYSGLWVDDWHTEEVPGEGPVKRQLRMYGVSEPWHESIVAVKTPLGIEPTWDWVLLERHDTPNYQLLPDRWRFAKDRATVRHLGPRCSLLPLNAGVIYKPDLNKKALTFAFGANPALILVREKDLLAEIVND